MQWAVSWPVICTGDSGRHFVFWLQRVELVRNLVAHGDAQEGKWRGKWLMEWVASTLTPPPNVVYPALLKLMRTSRLPAVDWTDAPTDLNGLVRFGERRNLVSARVPSRSARAIHDGDWAGVEQLVALTWVGRMAGWLGKRASICWPLYIMLDEICS